MGRISEGNEVIAVDMHLHNILPHPAHEGMLKEVQPATGEIIE